MWGVKSAPKQPDWVALVWMGRRMKDADGPNGPYSPGNALVNRGNSAGDKPFPVRFCAGDSDFLGGYSTFHGYDRLTAGGVSTTGFQLLHFLTPLQLDLYFKQGCYVLTDSTPKLGGRISLYG